MNCQCKNPRHPNHLGGHCTALATEPDNYCRHCHDKATDEAIAAINVPQPSRDSLHTSDTAKSHERKCAIEVRLDEDNSEHSLRIDGCVVDNAVVHESVISKGFFYLYSDFDDVTDKLLPHSLSDFLEARIKDIGVPFGVSWNEAIGMLSSCQELWKFI